MKFILFSTLFMLIFFTPLTINAQNTVSFTSHYIEIDQATLIQIPAFNINGNTFFKLRDLAYTFIGTLSEFDISWNSHQNIINIIYPGVYTSTGSELTINDLPSSSLIAHSSVAVMINGIPVTLQSYNINGNNFFRLQDLSQILNFSINFQYETLAIIITTGVSAHRTFVLPSRRLTAEELKKWIYQYTSLGGISQFEIEVFRLANLQRIIHGLSELTLDPHLFMAARFKSQEMVDLRYISHNSPIYGNFYEIPHLFTQNIAAENIHSTNSNTTPERIVQGWMNSQAHRENLLNPSFKTMGVGIFYAQHYFTVLHEEQEFTINGAATQLFGR